MGKRKSRRANAAPRKVQPKLEVAFTCPFCNHAKSVECTLDMRLKLGEARCRICRESYATAIHRLTEPIDVYSEWLDHCDEVNKSDDCLQDRRPSKRPAAAAVSLEDDDTFLSFLSN